MMARRTTTFEQLLRSTPTHWIESTEPLHVVWDDESMHFENDRLVIEMPRAVARRLKPRKGEVLEARLHPRGLELVRRKRNRANRN
jgi:hypothetical protein